MNYTINKSISDVEIPYEGHPYINIAAYSLSMDRYQHLYLMFIVWFFHVGFHLTNVGHDQKCKN